MSIFFWNRLRSLQGVDIAIDYVFEHDRVADDTLSYIADSLVVHVEQAPGILLSEFSVVNAVVIVLSEDRLPVTWQLSLTFQGYGENEIVQFSSPAITCGIGYVTAGKKQITRGQVAVWIDNIWQIDPVQMNPSIPEWEPHNFNFDWLDATHAPFVVR